MVYNDNIRYSHIAKNKWTIVDILSVLACVFIVILIISFLTTFIENEKTAFILFSYCFYLTSTSLPILWVKLKYKIKSNELGLTNGRYSFSRYILIGCSIAIFLALLFRISPFWQGGYNISTPTNYLHLLLYPVSIAGLPNIALAPLGEEVMFRGFLYGYFRKKVNVILALLLQASLFSALHLIYMYENPFQSIFFILAAIVFGILYEFTGSLYPSMICHGTLNYMLIILSVIN